MRAHSIHRLGALGAAALLALPAAAQAPGEDPVVLKEKLIIRMQPTAPVRPSEQLDGNIATQSWMRARIARYEAKAFSGDTAGIKTDNDVVTTSSAKGMQKVCVQEIASNTIANPSPGTQYGPGQSPQVVVLRGDLVNICR